MSIWEADNNSLRIGVANRIVQLLPSLDKVHTVRTEPISAPVVLLSLRARPERVVQVPCRD